MPAGPVPQGNLLLPWGPGKRVPGQIQPSDYYSLLVVWVGNKEVDETSPRGIKKDFKALGRPVQGLGAQVMFSSIPLVAGKMPKGTREQM